MKNTNKIAVGLALGSGGARGLSHIGVLKVLEKNNIPIDCISGSSIGAMVGGFYAAGLSVEKIETIALDTNWRLLFSLVDPRLKQGLISGGKVKRFIERCLPGTMFRDCKIPFSAVATDIKTGDVVTLRQGEMATAIRASISIPLIFKPVEIEGRLLADGGLSAPVPVETVRRMGATLIIAVNLDNHYFAPKGHFGFYHIADNALTILRHHLASWNVREADVVINPDVKGRRWHNFANGRELIKAGEDAAKKQLPQIKELWRQKSKGLSRDRQFLPG